MSIGDEGKDVFWASAPLLKFCRAAGIATFPLKRKEACFINKKVFIYSVALNGLLSFLDILYLCLLFVRTPRFGAMTILYLIWQITRSIRVVFGLLEIFRLRYCIYSLLVDMATLDDRFKLIKMGIHADRFRKGMFKQTIGFFSALVILFIVSCVIQPPLTKFFNLLSLSRLLISSLSANLIQQIPFMTIRHLDRRLSLLNECIALLGTGKTASQCADGNLSVTQRCTFLTSLHLDLYRLSETVRKTFGRLIFWYLLMMQIDVVVRLYRGLVFFSDQIQGNLAYLSIFWMVYLNFAVVLIVISCHSATKKADSTGVLVSEMLLKVKDNHVRRELRLFSNQLLHTKFHFSACRFFNLDFSLLTSMTAAVVTHLVILVQFQLAEKEISPTCDCQTSSFIESSITGAINRT